MVNKYGLKGKRIIDVTFLELLHVLDQLNGVFWYSLKFYFKSELISLMVQAGLF